jgi:hypothetical protein
MKRKGKKMGFDLYGLNAKNEKGEYFRSQVWQWGTLASYVLTYAGDCLDDEEKQYWDSNDGQLVCENHAVAVGNRLLELIQEGHTEACEKECLSNSIYTFSVENVKDFADFCINSGGFEIY